MVDPVSVGLMGASLIGGLAGGANKGGGSYGKRVRSINKRYREEKPQGYLTAEDHLEGERQRRRAGQSFGAYSSAGRAGAIRRSRARGVEGSPALERTLGRFAQDEGRFLEGISSNVEEQLYRTRMDREKFERDRLMNAWGAELGGDLRDWQSANARQSQFWNSLIPLAGDALGSIMGGGAYGTKGEDYAETLRQTPYP